MNSELLVASKNIKIKESAIWEEKCAHQVS